METLILIGGIIVTFSLLIAVHRLNINLARFMPTGTKTYPDSQPFYFINVAGKWLTLIGGVATFPLVMGLIFTPEANANWISTLGVLGCLTLFVGALLLIPVCIIQCLKCKVSIKRIVINTYHVLAKKVLKMAGYKMLVLIAGILILAQFVPFMADLLTFLVYVSGFVVAARIGMLDDLEANKSLPFSSFYNYSTGKWEDTPEIGGTYLD